MAAPPSHRDETRTRIRQAFKLALSLVLFYAFALWTNWDVPRYGGLAIVIVSLGTRGASIKQGLMRIWGTTAGVLVGIGLLALFGDDRWALMIALAANITLMCYCMQTSGYRYAWYAAAFIPLVVWADNYPHFDDTFYFTTFRWLETVVGVAIYTLVDWVFWPRSASDSLHAAGKQLIHSIQELLRAAREHASAGDGPTLETLRPKVAQQRSQTLSLLQNALFDSLNVERDKDIWHAWQREVGQLIDALEMWRESMIDGGALVDRLRPHSDELLDSLDARLTRMATLWDQYFSDAAVPKADDDHLLQPHRVAAERIELVPGAEFQQAALLSTVRQLEILDRSSCELLRTMRRLGRLEVAPVPPIQPASNERFSPVLWDAERLVQALFPAVTFIAAWLVWDLTNPPGGPKVAMLAGLLSIMVLRTPMNPLIVWVGMIISTAVVVAPLCWLVMPAMSNGFELLTLIFLMSFLFGCAKSPAIKSGALIQFFASAGISNQQSYSFEGPVNGSLMVLVGGCVVTVVYNLWFPIRPDQSLLRSLRRALTHFARYAGTFDWETESGGRQQARQRDYLMRAKISADLESLRSAVGTLDFGPYANNQREEWLRLVDSLHTLAFRFQAFAGSYQASFSEATMDRSPLTARGVQAMTAISEMMKDWAKLESPDVLHRPPRTLGSWRSELQAHVASWLATNQLGSNQEVLRDAYAVLGNLWTVFRALEGTQTVFQQVDCRQIAAPRF